MCGQLSFGLFGDAELDKSGVKKFRPVLSASTNRKGVLEVDTVKGCKIGMERYPNGGCYGLCYAAKMAKLYGFNFGKSVNRCVTVRKKTYCFVATHKSKWFRVGVMGEPSDNWELTTDVCEWLGNLKTPVIVTKHWVEMSNGNAKRLARAGAVINTSLSALDSQEEIEQRLNQHKRLNSIGLKSVLRLVTCKFGTGLDGPDRNEIQSKIISQNHVIDTPLRIPASDSRVKNGMIIVQRVKDFGKTTTVSLNNPRTFLGKCQNCPDQCGAKNYDNAE